VKQGHEKWAFMMGPLGRNYWNHFISPKKIYFFVPSKVRNNNQQYQNEWH
jgi:hypothetical protein